MDSPIVTLKLVAEAAGVSRMTVSLALRNHHSIPESTRRRVRESAERMGYHPDPSIGRLMEKIRAKKPYRVPSVIAYLTAHKRRGGWQDEETQRMYHDGAKQRAESLGYFLEEFWLHEPGMTERRLSNVLRNRGIEGALVAPIPLAQDLFLDFRWEYISAVELGYSLLQPALHRCCNHQFHSMMALMGKLYEAGYREIGLAMKRDQDERADHNWRAGYLAGCSLAGQRRSIPMLLSDDWNEKVFRAWLAKRRPDVIVTVGAEVGRWLNESDIRVPRDVGLANVDLRSDMGRVTGINQNSVDVGAAAVDALISLMRLSERGIPQKPRIFMVEGSYVQGTTTLRRKTKRDDGPRIALQ